MQVVLGPQQHGNHRRVPIVDVDDLRLKSDDRQRVDHRAGEVGVLFTLEIGAAVYGMAKVMFIVDKVNRNPVPVVEFHTHVTGMPADIDAEADDVPNLLTVPLLHDPVKRQREANIKPQIFELPGQCSDHIRQASGLGKRRAFRAGHEYPRKRFLVIGRQDFLQFFVHGAVPSSFSK